MVLLRQSTESDQPNWSVRFGVKSHRVRPSYWIDSCTEYLSSIA
jgi:hypothetical protein